MLPNKRCSKSPAGIGRLTSALFPLTTNETESVSCPPGRASNADERRTFVCDILTEALEVAESNDLPESSTIQTNKEDYLSKQ
jgi:hypothetical protein